MIGFTERGHDYLAEKQNDFLWMAEEDCLLQRADAVLPQVVVADFRLCEMPNSIQTIITKYSQQSSPLSFSHIENLITKVASHDEAAFKELSNLFLSYFSGREWELPTVAEFETIHEFNELLAWVLVFGRRPNHFTLSIHLLSCFKSLTAFHQFISNTTSLVLNCEGGVIKGGPSKGIAQGSTMGFRESIKLADGVIDIPSGFVEFVWRYSKFQQPSLWQDYFNDFIAQHADRVIESLS